MEFQEWWEKNKDGYLKLAKATHMDFYVVMAIRTAAEEAWNTAAGEEDQK